MFPADSETTRALVTLLQTGVVGAVFILFIAGIFRLKREVEREETATAREHELVIAGDARFDKAMLQIDRLSEGVDRMVQAVEKLAAKK